MPAIIFTISGDTQLIEKFAKLYPAVQAGLFAGGETVKAGIAVYPPKPPQSTYTRTGRLGRKWTIQQAGFLEVEVGNNTSYGPYVQGDQQTSFHAATGWMTTRQAKDAYQDQVTAEIQKEINRILGI